MKTIKILSVISLILLLYSFNTPKSNYNPDYEVRETINTLEDMIEWIEYDVEGGNIDLKTADTYIYNLDECINRLKKNL